MTDPVGFTDEPPDPPRPTYALLGVIAVVGLTAEWHLIPPLIHALLH